ncbi:hypothetical protein AB0K51_23265 [Kitasatospora sp. NPDC049285]|uniref:hypothetical protein n=1 Tax=Kitasatospora sp. NPDC049285 TaxID=3157096 RepID=UPI003445DF48
MDAHEIRRVVVQLTEGSREGYGAVNEVISDTFPMDPPWLGAREQQGLPDDWRTTIHVNSPTGNRYTAPRQVTLRSQIVGPVRLVLEGDDADVSYVRSVISESFRVEEASPHPAGNGKVTRELTITPSERSGA